MTNPTVELTLPVMEDMELAATKTAEVVAKRMGLDDMKTAEISMALIEACINAFEHSKTKDNVVGKPSARGLQVQEGGGYLEHPPLRFRAPSSFSLGPGGDAKHPVVDPITYS